MPDNDFWIGQEQIPVDLSLLLAPNSIASRRRRIPRHARKRQMAPCDKAVS